MMRAVISGVVRTSGLGGACASIVYFIERTYSHPFLAEDMAAYFVSAVGVILLAFSAEYE